MLRRDMLRLAPLALPVAAQAQTRPRDVIRERIKTRLEHLAEFRARLRELLANLPALEQARGYRELEYRHAGLTGLQASATPRGKLLMFAADTPATAPAAPAAPAATTLSISQDATDLITGFEIGSASLYTERYQAPTWPGGNSGVTIGVGYDLGYCSAVAFAKDWAGILPQPHQGVLTPVCTSKADKAEALAAQPVVKAVKVSWDQASLQFNRFLPLIVDETAEAFPNCAGLPADSLGALVSLVYNRGGDTSANKPSRVEMANIKTLMAAKNYAAVPEQITAMKRLWPTVPGLQQRRDLEAKLFTAGLAG